MGDFSRLKKQLANSKTGQFQLHSPQSRKRMKKKEQSLKEPGTASHTPIYSSLKFHKKARDSGTKIFEEIMSQKFLNLMKNMNLHIQIKEIQARLNQTNSPCDRL